MSLENSFACVTASTPQLMSTFQGKSFNVNLAQSSVSKKQNMFKSQASNFLKTELSNMMKDELKALRLQKKLQKQVEDFKKLKQKKKLVEDMHKVQKFREKQSQALKTKFDTYLKQKQNRDSMVQQMNIIKKTMIARKKYDNQQKIQSVRKRFFENQTQDIQNRLSRADSMLSQKSSCEKHSILTSRLNKTHMSVKSGLLNKSRIQDQQNMKITNYLKKMKHVQSRILEKQIKNEERKEKSIKSEVKNLTKDKNTKEQNKMKELEQKFNTKMGSFYQNISRIQMQNSALAMNKSRMKYEIRQKVIKRKQMNDSFLVNKTLQNFNRKKCDKQNLYRNHLQKIDFLRTKSSFLNNTIQIKKQQLEKQKQKSLRVLYEKLNRIKHLKPNETLSQKQRQNLLNLLDHDDPFFAQMSEYLNNTKNQFLRKKLQKEEEKAKAEKSKKNHHKN